MPGQVVLVIGFALSLLAGVSGAQDAPESVAPGIPAAIARPADALQDPAVLELHALQRLLETPPWVPGIWPSIADDSCPEVSKRLALFPRRFGRRPQDSEGWEALIATARTLLANIERDIPRPIRDIGLEDAWSGPQWGAARALLLDLSGRTDEARALLFGFDAIAVRGCCPYCRSEDLPALASARSEFAERHEDLRQALSFQEESLLFGGDDPEELIWEQPTGINALNGVRLGLLLLDDGQIEAGLRALESVLSVHPGSLGADIAAAELERRGIPAAARSGRLAVASLTRDACEWRALPRALLVGREGDPASWQLLALRLSCGDPEFPDADTLTSVRGFDGAVPDLVGLVITQPINVEVTLAAALALRSLGQSVALPLAGLVDHCAATRTAAMELSVVDRLLRLTSGGGPDLGELRKLPVSEICDAWMEWFATR